MKRCNDSIRHVAYLHRWFLKIGSWVLTLFPSHSSEARFTKIFCDIWSQHYVWWICVFCAHFQNYTRCIFSQSILFFGVAPRSSISPQQISFSWEVQCYQHVQLDILLVCWHQGPPHSHLWDYWWWQQRVNLTWPLISPDLFHAALCCPPADKTAQHLDLNLSRITLIK